MTRPTSTILFSLPTLALVAAGRDIHPRSSTPTLRWRRASPGFANPSDGGGSWLTQVDGTFPAGQGEPINAIISANSDVAVLKDQNQDGGLQNYFNALGYSTECLGQHSGDAQAANLGDGNGFVNQTAEIRWDYHDAELGTCEETIEGGSHFRYWKQDGSSANTGAIFMAVSYELPLVSQHDIIFNGYNLGRDWFIGNVTNQTSLIPTLNITNTSSYSGSTSFMNYTYLTTVQYMSGFAPNTSYAVNHNETVGSAEDNADDGFIAVLTVSITSRPAKSLSSRTLPPSFYFLLSFVFVASATLL